jgi:hypothetical protein
VDGEVDAGERVPVRALVTEPDATQFDHRGIRRRGTSRRRSGPAGRVVPEVLVVGDVQALLEHEVGGQHEPAEGAGGGPDRDERGPGDGERHPAGLQQQAQQRDGGADRDTGQRPADRLDPRLPDADRDLLLLQQVGDRAVLGPHERLGLAGPDLGGGLPLGGEVRQHAGAPVQGDRASHVGVPEPGRVHDGPALRQHRQREDAHQHRVQHAETAGSGEHGERGAEQLDHVVGGAFQVVDAAVAGPVQPVVELGVVKGFQPDA